MKETKSVNRFCLTVTLNSADTFQIIGNKNCVLEISKEIL